MTYDKKWYKKYTEKNREKLNKKAREWAKNNRDKRRTTEAKWRKSHPEVIKAQKLRHYLKNKLKVIKTVTKWKKNNPVKVKLYQKKYRDNNKEKVNLKIKEWQLKNLERYKESQRLWQLKNRKRRNAQNVINQKRYRLNIYFRLSQNIGSDIWHALRDKKYSTRWQKLVGYSTKDLIKHLESQFDEKMSWDNYGSYWSIDHKKPRSLFRFNSHKDKEFIECWSLNNLQPMEKIANIIKGKKYDGIAFAPSQNI